MSSGRRYLVEFVVAERFVLMCFGDMLMAEKLVRARL